MKKKAIFITLMLTLGLIFIWFNIVKPCKISDKAKIFIYEDYGLSDEIYDTKTYDNLISVYNGKGATQVINDEKLVRTDGELPSDKTKDYKSIGIHIKVKNRSIFKQEHFVASIEMEEHSNILFTDDNLVYENVKAFKTDDVTVMWLEMYCGDMTDEEIAEYIKGLTIKVSYGNSITGVKTESVKISDVIEIRR